VHRFEKFIRNEDVVFCLDVDDVLLNLTSEWNTLINKDKECIAILKEKNMYPLKEEDWKYWDFITDTLSTKEKKYKDFKEMIYPLVGDKYSLIDKEIQENLFMFGKGHVI